MTDITNDFGWSEAKVESRETEISRVSKFFGFDEVNNLCLPTIKLDTLPIGGIVQKISDFIKLYLP